MIDTDSAAVLSRLTQSVTEREKLHQTNLTVGLRFPTLRIRKQEFKISVNEDRFDVKQRTSLFMRVPWRSGGE